MIGRFKQNGLIPSNPWYLNDSSQKQQILTIKIIPMSSAAVTSLQNFRKEQNCDTEIQKNLQYWMLGQISTNRLFFHSKTLF